MKLLITGAWNYSKQDIAELANLGFDCIFHKNEKDPLPIDFFDVDGIVCNGLFLYNDPASFKNLKFIQLTSAGMDRIPFEYFKSIGVKIFNATGVYSIPISEFVISSILSFYRRLDIVFENQKKHLWIKQRNVIELTGKNICILGCGSVGTECAKKFKAFNCRVYGIDTRSISCDIFDSVESIENVNSVIRLADIVVLSLPLTESTKYLVDDKFLSCMKSTALLVNVSRGGVVKTPDLINALKNKLIFGAILDVFEEEPLSICSPLWSFENVLISPHSSFLSNENQKRLSQLILSNLETLL